jgi:hypothetical protein
MLPISAAIMKAMAPTLAAMVENPQPMRNQEEKRGQAESPDPAK